jgi:hypothetical protein
MNKQLELLRMNPIDPDGGLQMAEEFRRPDQNKRILEIHESKYSCLYVSRMTKKRKKITIG